MTLSTSLKLASLSLILSDVLCLKSPAPITIQVCQNKDCCRRFQAQSKLPEVLEDLLDDSVSIQATGCLSHCGKGPNVCIKHLGKAGFRGGITNPSLAVLFLEEELQEQPLSTKRIAAVKVLEKGHQASSFPEQERFYSSVIQMLSSDPDLDQSLVLMHAFVLRAQCRCEAERYQDLLDDCSVALDMIHGKMAGTNATVKQKDRLQERLAQVYRLQSRAYEGLGQSAKAVEALSLCAQYNPMLQTKANREIERLLATIGNQIGGEKETAERRQEVTDTAEQN